MGFLLAAAGCAMGSAGAGRVTLRGQALDAKGGAVVRTQDDTVYVSGLGAWPAETAGRLVEVTGILSRRTFPALPVGRAGERSGGAEGTQTVLEDATWKAAAP
jgi:hypothetical protein